MLRPKRAGPVTPPPRDSPTRASTPLHISITLLHFAYFLRTRSAVDYVTSYLSFMDVLWVGPCNLSCNLVRSLLKLESYLFWNWGVKRWRRRRIWWGFASCQPPLPPCSLRHAQVIDPSRCSRDRPTGTGRPQSQLRRRQRKLRFAR